MRIYIKGRHSKVGHRSLGDAVSPNCPLDPPLFLDIRKTHPRNCWSYDIFFTLVNKDPLHLYKKLCQRFFLLSHAVTQTTSSTLCNRATTYFFLILTTTPCIAFCFRCTLRNAAAPSCHTPNNGRDGSQRFPTKTKKMRRQHAQALFRSLVLLQTLRWRWGQMTCSS